MKYIISLLLILMTTSALANHTKIVFVGTTFPGILQQDEKGHVSGLAADIIQQIMAPLTLTYSILVVPWKRAQSMMQTKQADVLIGPYKTPAREKIYHFTERPFYMDDIVLYTHKTNTFNWQGDLTVLHNKAMAVPLGWTGGILYEKHKKDIRVYDVPGLKNGLEMVAKNRIEFVLANLRSAQYILKHEGIEDKVKLLQPRIQRNYGYFGFSKTSTNLLIKAQFSQALSKFHDSGEVTALNHRYGFQFEKEKF